MAWSLLASVHPTVSQLCCMLRLAGSSHASPAFRVNTLRPFIEAALWSACCLQCPDRPSLSQQATMELIHILDLNDDILCLILRRVAASEDGVYMDREHCSPVLKVGPGHPNLEVSAVLHTAATCKRLRSILCSVLPTRCA
jgi:hypothetical protein